MEIQTSYLICATARSGTNLLCVALKNTGVAGRPTEWFNPYGEAQWRKAWSISTYEDYLNRVIEESTTSNGVFAAKIMEDNFDVFIGKLRQIPKYERLGRSELLSMVFPNLRYIWTTRRNKVRQAISWLKATQTGIWSLAKGELTQPVKEANFDFEAIDRLAQEIILSEASWEEFFAECGVSPFTVVYEDLVASYEATIMQVLEYLGIHVQGEIKFVERGLQKQADAQSDNWYQHYTDMKRERLVKQPLPTVELPSALR